MNIFKLKLETEKNKKNGAVNMKKVILPVVIVGAVALNLYGVKKYLARKNNISNAEL